MASRSTRRLITDRLRQAEKFLSDANGKLSEVKATYFELGYPHGAELEMISEALKLSQLSVERFRRERA